MDQRFVNQWSWLCIYERAVQVLLGRHLQPEAVFYDIGANVGFFSLLASRLVGSRGYVAAFEPLPRNFSFMKSHLKLNRMSNMFVLETGRPSSMSGSQGR